MLTNLSIANFAGIGYTYSNGQTRTVPITLCEARGGEIMVRSITRIDRAGILETQFFYQDTVTGLGGNCAVPTTDADALEATIIAASWASLTALFELDGETIIKTE